MPRLANVVVYIAPPNVIACTPCCCCLWAGGCGIGDGRCVGAGFPVVVMLIMDGCLLGSTLNGNKLYDIVGSDFEFIIECDEIVEEKIVDGNLEVLNHIVLV